MRPSPSTASRLLASVASERASLNRPPAASVIDASAGASRATAASNRSDRRRGIHTRKHTSNCSRLHGTSCWSQHHRIRSNDRTWSQGRWYATQAEEVSEVKAAPGGDARPIESDRSKGKQRATDDATRLRSSSPDAAEKAQEGSSEAAAAAAYSATVQLGTKQRGSKSKADEQPRSKGAVQGTVIESSNSGGSTSFSTLPTPPNSSKIVEGTAEPLLTSEELLKMRSFLAQSRNEELRKMNALDSSSNISATLVLDSKGAGPSSAGGSGSSGGDGGGGAGEGGGTSSEQATGGQMEATNAQGPPFAQVMPSVLHPFDTRVFVDRLEAAGFVRKNGWAEAAPDATDASSSKSSAKGKGKVKEGPAEKENVDVGTQETKSLQKLRNRDPAQAIMEATKGLLVEKSNGMLHRALNKTDLENEAYLFSAALSELRTELQVRARNDAAALRSLTTLLQREVDSLNQKMREDINTLKHDIQVDMNTRKSESKEEQNQLEQDIQDLQNRFTISLSDLKTEIEQNIKWDATRRSLALVFGIAAILIATLSIADFYTRLEEEEQEASAESAGANGSNKKRSANGSSGVAGGSAGRGPGRKGNGKGGRGDEDDEAYLPRSAEELGLVPQYATDGSRFV